MERINLSCDMLIDQNRYIGSDPVGCSCSNIAIYEIKGFLFCERCKDLLENEPERLTFPPVGGAKYQVAMIQRILIRMFGNKGKVIEGES